MPQAWEVCGGCLQEPPVQQPSAQFDVSQPVHILLLHMLVAMHCWHKMPPEPHAVLAVPVWHLPFMSQQPSGHERESQMHAPMLQRVPLSHCAPPLHWHTPPSALHESARFRSHAWHVAPAGPHAAALGGAEHSPPSGVQHPPVHSAGSHTHAPPSQRVPAGQAELRCPHTQTPARQ
jgi:hypothetical protein